MMKSTQKYLEPPSYFTIQDSIIIFRNTVFWKDSSAHQVSLKVMEN